MSRRNGDAGGSRRGQDRRDGAGTPNRDGGDNESTPEYWTREPLDPRDRMTLIEDPRLRAAVVVTTRDRDMEDRDDEDSGERRNPDRHSALASSRDPNRRDGQSRREASAVTWANPDRRQGNPLGRDHEVAHTSRDPRTRPEEVVPRSTRDVNRSGESGSGRRRDRDSSPSAHSQSSMMSTALEWDPSADVGTSMNPTLPRNPQGRRLQDAGLSTLERMAINLTSKPQGTLLRSHSEDNTTGEVYFHGEFK